MEEIKNINEEESLEIEEYTNFESLYIF